MKTIEILVDTALGSKPVKKGQKLAAPAADADWLVHIKKAKYVEAKTKRTRS